MADPADIADPRSLLAALSWLIEAGADEAVADAPTDWRALAAPAGTPAPARASGGAGGPRKAAAPAPVSAEAPGLHSAEALVAAAQAAAAAAHDLAALEAAVAGFDGLSIRRTASHTVFGRGPAQPRLLLLGDAPSEADDREGAPFAGEAGRLLDRMLAAIALTRDDIYLCPLLPWRPPGDRTPTPAEVAVSLAFRQRQIALLRPRLVLTLSGLPAQALLATRSNFSRLRGRWHPVTCGGWATELLPTYHPTRLLGHAAEKRAAWQDLLQLQARLRDSA